MGCCHYPAVKEGCDSAFTVDTSRITFGPGCLREVGDRARALGMKRVALFSDARVARLPHFEKVRQSLLAAGLDVVVFTDVHVEPTDASFQEAARFASESRPDGYVSLGGGSVIDTCKAANLYATHPADFLAYVNAPVGEGRAVPGPLKPHLACPTTSGTGSEVTGITIFDLLSLSAKTGIASPALRPTEALIDPDCTATLPGEVVAASGLDVLSHALESYTARPFVHRPAPARPSLRPMSQGANPWSDLGCREALRLMGLYLERGVKDARDTEAREQLMWAATLAGIAFGNAGVHAPHGMAYAVAGRVRDFRPSGYPQDEPLVPHGLAVIVNAPAVFRYTASANPERHLEAAGFLGADVRGAGSGDAGEVLAGRVVQLMRAVDVPNGLSGVGYTAEDVDALTEGAFPQQRLLQNAPREMTRPVLTQLFHQALRYW
ncbi:alcohol dehydrogenase [Corallococcus coralloides DSM 2259]|uniref:hydroxyacid-oxoacid transhydrogenase n=1 Tax=Corallococcus coralloides (strain ATCC 25202 / DSM 2259 / NBRC 100086 / M2) TaxID=1144275 RepID=H8MID9_CORCM|nr:hydroxyacid-oxoacid transhydrogenase [Corallococcus coralloides]AFE09375.1 alcohol dehydrogenase [Corallococcus coralloides DSM 2259]